MPSNTVKYAWYDSMGWHFRGYNRHRQQRKLPSLTQLEGIIKRMGENEYLSYEKCIFAGKWLRIYTFFAFRLAFWAKMNNFAPDFNGS